MIEPRHFKIRNHRLVDVDYHRTPNISGRFGEKPTVIVMHDTAGPSLKSACDWLTSRQARASAHVIIDRNGHVVQLAPFNIVTWHAGKSRYRGRAQVNAFSIGIEHVNPGRLSPSGRAWFGRQYQSADWAETAEHGGAKWLAYTEPQLAASAGIVVALAEKYPSLADVVGHWFVSPGRKVDTNPLFPMEQMLTMLEGRGGEATDAEPDVGPTGRVTVDLNMRRWPSDHDNVITVIPAGSKVEIIRSGIFAHGFPEAQWHLVRHDNREGWVHGFYVEERWPPQTVFDPRSGTAEHRDDSARLS